MSRLLELFERPVHHSHHPMSHALADRPKTSIASVVTVGLGVAALVWMWPEIKRYINIKRM